MLYLCCPFASYAELLGLHSFPTRRSSDLITAGLSLLVYALVDANSAGWGSTQTISLLAVSAALFAAFVANRAADTASRERSEEHTSELQSLRHLVCRLLLEKKKITDTYNT